MPISCRCSVCPIAEHGYNPAAKSESNALLPPLELYPMNREKMAWTVSVLLIALLAFQLPGTLAQRDDDYAFVRTLVDIHRQVVNNYVDGVDEEKLHEGAIDGMLGQLDPFSVYVPPSKQEDFDRMLEGSFKGVGIQLNPLPDGKIEVVTPIDGSPAFKAGVMAGDIILKVNGESIEGLKLPEVIKKISGKLGTEVKLTVKHETGEEVELSMNREEIIVPTVKGYSRKGDNSWDYFVVDNPKIAFIRITQFTPDTYEKVRDAIGGLLSEGMKGLILDLRFNPGGRLDEAVQIVDLFVKEGTIVSTKGRNRPERVETASEIVAGSLMDNHRALVIGQRTYGKGSVQELIPMDSRGGELKLTVAYYYLPSGRLVHRKKDAKDWGVEPQIVIPMDSAAEQRIFQDRYEQELFRRPVPKTQSRPTTTQASGTGSGTSGAAIGSGSGSTTTKAAMVAATQPVDPQLQQAVTTMIGLVVLQGDRDKAPARQEKPIAQSVKTVTPATTQTAR
jgi:carboxyl-terminal processing protease